MKKSTKKQSIKSKLLAFLAVLSLVGLGIFIYLRSIQQTSQIALIGGSTCTSNLSTFQANKSCSADGFSQYTYSCKQNPSSMITTAPGCVSFRTAYSQALAKCGQECSEQVTPIASAVQNEVSCRLLTYKRPGWLDGWSEDQLINPSGASVNPGEQIAYALEIVNSTPNTITDPLFVTSSTLNGEKEPVKVRSWGGLCELNQLTKAISCTEKGFSIAANTTKRLPSMTVVYEIVAPPAGVISTGVTFGMKLGNRDVKCLPPATYITINSSPAPSASATAVPSPSVKPSCTPRPACLDAKVPCKIADKPGMYCPTPAPTCVPYPSCRPGLKCAIPALGKGQTYCTSSPSPAPTCVPYPCQANAKCKLPQLSDGRTYCPPVPTKCRYMLGKYCIFR